MRSKRTKAKPTVKPDDVLQIRFAADGGWMDYARIRDGEVATVIAKVDAGVQTVNAEGKRAEFRIVRRFMGQKVIRGSSLE